MKRNWFAFAAGVLMLTAVISSLSAPWWRLQVGENLIVVDADPFYASFSILGVRYFIPIVSAMNAAAAALFVAGGVTLIIYALKPAKDYSRRLLSFGWKRPIQVLTVFIIMLAVMVRYAAPAAISMIAHGASASAQIDVPLTGSSMMQLPEGILDAHVKVAVALAASFTHSFYLGAAAAALSIAARICHSRCAGNAKAGAA